MNPQTFQIAGDPYVKGKSIQWVNNPTLTEFCFGMIGRADIEGSKSNVAMNAWLPQASSVVPAVMKPPDRLAVDYGSARRSLSGGRSPYLRTQPFGLRPTPKRALNRPNPLGAQVGCGLSLSFWIFTSPFMADFASGQLPTDVWYQRLHESFPHQGVLPQRD